jgi:peroxiredoxin
MRLEPLSLSARYGVEKDASQITNGDSMKQISIIFLAGVLALAFSSSSSQKIENFTLNDYNGIPHSLAQYHSSPAIVLIFISTQCPVSNAYDERMVSLSKEYLSRGVIFLGINANSQENVEDIKAHAQEHGFLFPVLKDKDNIIADKLKASVTPEVFVCDSSLTILYHGRIDDSRRETDVTSRDLHSALDAILSGKPIAVAETKAFGCSIKRSN